jgi:hypothetical protein
VLAGAPVLLPSSSPPAIPSDDLQRTKLRLIVSLTARM